MKNPKYEKMKQAANLIGYNLRIRKCRQKKQGNLPDGYIYTLEKGGIRWCISFISDCEFENLVRKPRNLIAKEL